MVASSSEECQHIWVGDYSSIRERQGHSQMLGPMMHRPSTLFSWSPILIYLVKMTPGDAEIHAIGHG